MKRIDLLNLLLLVSLALLIQDKNKVDPQNNCGFVQNETKQRVSWKGNFPIKYSIHKNMPKKAIGPIKKAAAHWNKKFNKEIFVIDETLSLNNDPNQDGENGIYWLNNWDKTKSNEQGRASIYWRGSRLYEADILINGQMDYISINSSSQGEAIDLESLLIHEFGHALGLDHNNALNSVMGPILEPNTLRREISKEDTSSLFCEYEKDPSFYLKALFFVKKTYLTISLSSKNIID